jgi:hypothetical protein
MNGRRDWRGSHRTREREQDATGVLDVVQHLSQRAFVELNTDSLRSYCDFLGSERCRGLVVWQKTQKI